MDHFAYFKIMHVTKCKQEKLLTFHSLVAFTSTRGSLNKTAAELMVRVGPDQWLNALAEEHAREMDFTGKSLKGFVYVDPAGWATKKGLGKWVAKGVRFAESLPPKD